MAQPDAFAAYTQWKKAYVAEHGRTTNADLKAAWAEHKGGAMPAPSDSVDPNDTVAAAATETATAALSDDEVYYRQVLQASGEEDDTGKPVGKLTVEPLAFAFESLFALFAGFLGPWWALQPKEATKIARAWRAWVRSLPKRQAQFLLRLERDVMPTLSLAGTVLGIVVPRWDLTVRARRGERPSVPRPAPAQAAPPGGPAAHGPASTNGGPRRADSGIIPAGTPGHDPFAEEIAEEIERSGDAA